MTFYIKNFLENKIKKSSKIFDKLYQKGDIYKSTYKGKYCVPCESFWSDDQLIDGKCPDCGREINIVFNVKGFEGA